MPDFTEAIELIKKYEGFNELAFCDPETGGAPYTIGFGSQFYPDGAAVQRGQRCSRKKALEYLAHEIEIISDQLNGLNLPLTHTMRQALISFIHSVGWPGFLYSSIVDAMEINDVAHTIDLMGQWIFDANHKVIGGLIERRRDEVQLFLEEVDDIRESNNSVLLKAFSAYCGTPIQRKAVLELENHMNPYTLSEFINNFCLSKEEYWIDYSAIEFDEIITLRA